MQKDTKAKVLSSEIDNIIKKDVRSKIWLENNKEKSYILTNSNKKYRKIIAIFI